jgi:hypothetical protein
MLRAGGIGAGMLFPSQIQRAQIEFLEILLPPPKEAAIHSGTNQLDTMLI